MSQGNTILSTRGATTMTSNRKPDTFGWQDPAMIERCQRDVAEYESYLPMIEGNGGTGSTKAKVPKVAKRTVHVVRITEAP